MLAAKRSCPAYDYALSKLKQSEEFEDLDRKFSKLYEYLTENTGRNVDSLEEVQRIYSCLYIESLYNFTYVFLFVYLFLSNLLHCINYIHN